MNKAIRFNCGSVFFHQFACYDVFCISSKMPRGTYLSEQEKGKILAYRDSDVKIREIARRLNRSHHVVLNFLKNPDGYGKNKKGGPKKKLSKRCQRRIINAASNSLKSLNQIKAELMLDVSRSTVYRTLKDSPNIRRQKLKQAPRLLPRHKANRLQFARDNMRRDWSKVCNHFDSSLTFF